MSLTFNNLKIQGHGSTGTLSFEAREVVWASRGSSSVRRQLAYEKIRMASWSVFGKFGLLSLYDGSTGDMLMRIDGFRRSDRDKLSDALAKHDINVQERDYSSEASSHGQYHVDGSSFMLLKDSKHVLELDLRTVSQCVLPAGPGTREPKEVTMQFVETDAGDADEHQLVEMRLWVPTTTGDDEEGEIEVSAAARLQQQVTQIARTDTQGEMLAEFADGTFLVPRGRYGVEMYGTFFRMHGNMYDYKIAYADVDKYYLLPRNDDVHYVLVLCLDKPIRQGQQRYPYLVWQLKMSEASIDINMSAQDLAARYPGLQPTLAGALYQSVARIFKSFSGKKIYSVGKFESIDGRKAISCSLKAKSGHLYPLERSFVFIHQPTLVLRFEDISSVEFERFAKGSATRNFDLRVTMKSFGGDSRVEEHVFASIERAEYKPLLSFLSEKKLNLVNLEADDTSERQNLSEVLGDEDDDDESRGSEDEDEEEDDDFRPNQREDDDDDDDDGDEEDEEEKEDVQPTVKAVSSKKKTKRDAEADDTPRPGKKAKVSAKKPTTKKKRKKDPNAPKGKSSAYIIFSTAKRSELKLAHPDLSTTEISKELGKLWNSMSDDDKRPYTEQAKADAERYDAEMAKYRANQKDEENDDEEDEEGGDDDDDDEGDDDDD